VGESLSTDGVRPARGRDDARGAGPAATGDSPGAIAARNGARRGVARQCAVRRGMARAPAPDTSSGNAKRPAAILPRAAIADRAAHR
jgi:hypothetical protein